MYCYILLYKLKTKIVMNSCVYLYNLSTYRGISIEGSRRVASQWLHSYSTMDYVVTVQILFEWNSIIDYQYKVLQYRVGAK